MKKIDFIKKSLLSPNKEDRDLCLALYKKDIDNMTIKKRISILFLSPNYDDSYIENFIKTSCITIDRIIYALEGMDEMSDTELFTFMKWINKCLSIKKHERLPIHVFYKPTNNSLVHALRNHKQNIHNEKTLQIRLKRKYPGMENYRKRKQLLDRRRNKRG